MGWDLDFNGQTVEDVDKSGGRPPDGYYRVVLDATEPDQEDGSQVFHFRICHGPQSRRKVKAKLSNPMLMTDQHRREVAMNRAKIFGVRMGLVDKSAEGKTANADWDKAVGKEFVVKLKTRAYTPAAGKNAGQQVEFQDIDFAGIFPLDHHDLDGATRTQLGLPLLQGQTVGPPPAAAGNTAAPAAPAAPAKTPDQLADMLFG